MKLCHFNCRGPVFFETHCVAMIISCLSSEIFVSLIGSEHFREFHAKKLAACICESSHFYDFWTILLLPAKVEVFVLLYFFFVCSLFVNDFSTTRGPIQAKFCIQAYSGSGYVFSPFGGWRPPAGGKRGKWNFRYYGNFCILAVFERYLNNAWTDPHQFYLCRDNVCRRAPSPSGVHRPLGGGGGGVKNSKKMGSGFIRAADSYHFFFRSTS